MKTKTFKTLVFILIISLMGCSESSSDALSIENCSPKTELKAFDINGSSVEFNVVDGKDISHVDDESKSFFYRTDFSDFFIQKYLGLLEFTQQDLNNIYNIELFIEKTKANPNNPIVDGQLVSAIIHFIDENNYLRVRYFELNDEVLAEVKELSRIVPFISATASYFNFMYLKDRGKTTNSYLLFNKNIDSPQKNNSKPFEKSLIKYLKKKDNFPNELTELSIGVLEGGCGYGNQCREANGNCETSGGAYQCDDGSSAGFRICSASATVTDLKSNNKSQESTLLLNTFPQLYQLESFLSGSEKGEEFANIYWEISRLSNDGTVSISLSKKVEIALFVANNVSLISRLLNGSDSDILYDSTKSNEMQNFLISLQNISNDPEWQNLFTTLIQEVQNNENISIGLIKSEF